MKKAKKAKGGKRVPSFNDSVRKSGPVRGLELMQHVTGIALDKHGERLDAIESRLTALESARATTTSPTLSAPMVGCVNQPEPKGWRDECAVTSHPAGFVVRHRDRDLHPDGRWPLQYEEGWSVAHFPTESGARAALAAAKPPPGVEEEKPMREWGEVVTQILAEWKAGHYNRDTLAASIGKAIEARDAEWRAELARREGR